ncbi:MAG: hypothetical protein IH608_10475 [Proteobacteria bacterium]|nr:hypothetical protein [Pseudomonadota bacterium]
MSDLSGHPAVEKDDLNLAAFVFALSEAILAEVAVPTERKQELLQRLAAQAYLQMPRGNLPDPIFYWLFLVSQAELYREAVGRDVPNRKFTRMADHFLAQYSLGGSDNTELVHGVCRLIAPVIREARQFFRARVDLIDDGSSAAPAPIPCGDKPQKG